MIFPKPRTPGSAFLAGPVGRAGVIGLHIVSGILTGGVIGHALDKWLETRFLLWIFLLIGFIAGCLNMYRDTRKLLREQDAIDAEKNLPKH